MRHEFTGRAAGARFGPASRRRQGEASETETGDGVLALTVLRQVDEYREAWRRHAAAAGLKPHERGDFLPDPFGLGLDLPVAKMGIAQRHAHLGMTE